MSLHPILKLLQG